MADQRNWHSSRLSQGGTVARVLLIILGVVLILFSSIILIAVIGITFDGDPSILILLPFALCTLVGAIFIIYSQVKSSSKDAEAQDGDDVTVVSSKPIAGVPVASPNAGDHGGLQQGPAPAADTSNSSAEDVAHLVYRSTDLFATLRDLVRHDSSSGAQLDKHHLASMLEAAGVMNWREAPACEGGRLTRNNHFWIRLSTDDLTNTQYDTLIATEAALGVNQDLPNVRQYGVETQEAKQAASRLMSDMCDQHIERAQLTEEGLRVCYHDKGADDLSGEWVVRSSICNAAECLRTPFRVVFDLRSNVADGVAVISLEIPRPRCMAIFTPDTTAQQGLARAYAFRLSYLLAAHALEASDKLSHVIVNCHEHGSEETLLSLDVSQDILNALHKVAASSTIESGFPTDERIRASFAGSWFKPVEPFLALDDPAATPQAARIFPELDLRPAPESIVRTCHAKRICDLGINENAARVAAWNALRDKLGTSTEKAVSALKEARDAADDITVAEACNRTMQALVEGNADLDDSHALAELFINGSALDRAVARAIDLLDDSNGHEDPETAVKVLETALAPIEDMGGYLDDETHVYRYFGSVSERIHHNSVIDEGGREIRLVPDAYFNAHSNASIALGMLGRNEEALAHADVCLRLAPTSTYATMRKVRVLESESRIYEAADLIKEALRHAVTPRDAAICHYRLAYMEWKLGREDLAVACYQRSMSWDTEMASQAREELDDLLSSNQGLERLNDEQADALLAREGIPLGCVRSDGERTLASAVACMDNEALFSARPLMAVLFGMNGDDVVMGVYRSLNVSV